MADQAAAQGVCVVGLHKLPAERDLVVFSDAATCHELAARYANAVRLFVAHSADFMLQAPPQLEDRCQAVIALNNRVQRAIAARAWHPRIVRLRQPIDLLRFRALAPPRSQARVVVVLSNRIKGPRAGMIEDACRAAGLEPEWIGLPTTPTAAPELALAQADLVIGCGRCALEAMAAGRATYVYGVSGGDGWVTPDLYPAMEADGFAGTAARERVINKDRLAEDLSSWDSQMGEVCRDLASANHSAREHASGLVELARELDPTPPAAPSHSDELARLVRLELQNFARIWPNLAEVERMRELLDGREHEISTLRDRLAATEAAARIANNQLEFIHETRRYRLACRIAAPLDRMRGANRE
jgi:hypothetical protein